MSPRKAESDRVLGELTPLATLLYQILEAAVHDSLEYFVGRKQDVDGWLFSALVRHFVKTALRKLGYDTMDEEDSPDSLARNLHSTWELDGEEVNTRYLQNNGLQICYKGYEIRIWKRHRRTLSASPDDFPQDEEQLALDFGVPSMESRHLLIIWDVSSSYGLMGLELVAPLFRNGGPALVKWSKQIRHPVELITGESIKEQYKYDQDLPVAFPSKRKRGVQ